MPVWRFLPHRFHHDGDATNKWIPNLAGLTSALDSALPVVDALVPEGVDFAYVKAQTGGGEVLSIITKLDSSEGVWGDNGLEARPRVEDAAGRA